LALLTLTALAGVLMVELTALSATGPLPLIARDVRIPLRILVGVGLGLLSATAVMRARRPAAPEVPTAAEPVVEPETFSPGVKRLVLIASVPIAILGGLGVVGFMLIGCECQSALAAISLASFVGGIIAFVHVRRSLAGLPSGRLRMPPSRMLMMAFVLVVVAGEVTRRTTGWGLGFIPLLLLGAAIPPLTALSLAAARVGRPPTTRRIVMAAVAGGTLACLAALVLEIVLPGIIFLLVAPVADLIREMIRLVDQGKFSDLLRSPGALVILSEMVVLAPIVEEAVKPLAVILLGRRLQSARDAWMIGMASGAGFALVENIMYETGWLGIWTGITIVRGIGGALHPFGAGLLSLGWFGVFHREPDAWRRLVRCYLIAVGLHALWNGASWIFMLLEASRRALFGPIGIQGMIIDVGMLALLAAEGIVLLWLVREMARRLAAEQQPVPAPDPARTLALWALACMAVLLPVALAAASTVLRYMGAVIIR
jgi:RsiW-degrading membrane proteinase PrsW (M82 family)